MELSELGEKEKEEKNKRIFVVFHTQRWDVVDLIKGFKTQEQAEKLCSPQVFHSKSSDKYYNSFLAEEIDYLGVVKAVNEGHNIPNMDMSLIVQLNSRELDVIQRIGRIVRWRFGHVATIYIIVATDTQDEVWLQKALQGFDSKHITYINSNSI